jgi:hypothetical protein
LLVEIAAEYYFLMIPPTDGEFRLEVISKLSSRFRLYGASEP